MSDAEIVVRFNELCQSRFCQPPRFSRAKEICVAGVKLFEVSVTTPLGVGVGTAESKRNARRAAVSDCLVIFCSTRGPVPSSSTKYNAIMLTFYRTGAVYDTKECDKIFFATTGPLFGEFYGVGRSAQAARDDAAQLAIYGGLKIFTAAN